MPDNGPLSLRERKKLDTRKALSDAAVALAVEHGVEKITREDIAAVAGVSVRTFSNYFTGKYDAIAYRKLQRNRRSVDALRGRPAGEPLWVAITASVLEPVELEVAAEMLRSRAELEQVRDVLITPQVRAAVSGVVVAEWVDAIAERTATDPHRHIYPRLVAAAIVAVVDAATIASVQPDPPGPITTLMRDGFAAVMAGLPEPVPQVTTAAPA